MQSGDLVKYIGEGWPRTGTLGIVLANRSLAKDAEVDQIDQTYSVKVHWSAKSGGEAAWEDPRTLAPAAVAEIYFK